MRGKGKKIQSVTSNQLSVVTGKEIRKKFDTEYWENAKVAKNQFKLVSFNDTVALEINKESKGFSFCELTVKKA
jgi:hypothetical protein